MARRVLPALLVFTAFLCDLGGNHAVALGFLLCAIPAAFVLALDCYGDALEARCSRVRPSLGGLSVVLLVLSAALRSPAVVGGVPQLAVSALVLTLVLYVAIAVGALSPARQSEPAIQRVRRTEADRTRRAA
jgi:hypothetical protein